MLLDSMQVGFVTAGVLGFFLFFLWDSCQDELYVLFVRAMSNVCVNL